MAWNREILNATTTDNMNYTVTDPTKGISLGYTFALDMNTIEIPAQMADIVFMLPNSDTQGDSAFGYMLALAERVSILTEVRITAQFDKDLIVDVSGLKVVNDFFALTSATVDENNQLTMIFNWIDRTEAIDAATANPLCIMSGIKAYPKDGAWDGSELIVANSGNVSYDVYLRASSLYSFAQRPENQQKYGLKPYSSSETGWEGGTETGAHYASVYADFEDGFIVDNAIRQGWYKEDGIYKYYVNHAAVTGVQYLPSREDESINLFYEFNDEGICLGKMTGTVNYKGALYYAVNGVKTTGWISGYDAEGNAVDYYFTPSTGKAVNGAQKIDGYNYVFEDYILVRGDLVKDANGTRYRWAGQWVHGKWFQVDGNWYTTKKYVYYVIAGGLVYMPQRETPNYEMHLFDENGVFLENYVGLYEQNGNIHYIVNGMPYPNSTVVEVDGYYYYTSYSEGKVYKDCTMWVSRTGGLIPAGQYTLRMEEASLAISKWRDKIINIEPYVNEDSILYVDASYFYYPEITLKPATPTPEATATPAPTSKPTSSTFENVKTGADTQDVSTTARSWNTTLSKGWRVSSACQPSGKVTVPQKVLSADSLNTM